MSQQRSIVGGVFGLERNAPASVGWPPLVGEHDLLFANGRSALRESLIQLRPSRVWLPAFICPDVIQVAKRLGRCEFFDRDDACWHERTAAGELAVVLDEFGFLADRRRMHELRRRGVVVVEDAAQALLTATVGDEADYVIFSPRKFVGVVDGGILSPRLGKRLEPPRWIEAPDAWFQLARRAAEERARFDERGGRRDWFPLFQQAEAEQPCGPHPISELSQEILMSGLDWPAISARRRANYSFLLESLADLALYPEMTPETVPLGFALRLANRDAVREALFAAEIFPPIHWKLEQDVPRQFEAAHRLASQILTLPCDQRYTPDDLRLMAEIVRRKGARCSDT